MRALLEGAARAERLVTPGLFALLCATVVWAAFRGFDLTDESYHLYFYTHPDSQLSTTLTQYFRVVAGLMPQGVESVVAYRLVKLPLLAGTAMLFALALRAWLWRSYPEVAAGLPPTVVLLAFVGLGSLLAYGHGPQTLSYNDLTTICFIGAVGLLFWACGGAPGRGVLVAKGAGLGVLLVAQAFVKPPSAVLLAVGLAVLSALVARQGDRWRLGWAAAGAAAALVACTMLLTDLGVGTWLLARPLIEAYGLPIPHGNVGAMLVLYVQGLLQMPGRMVNASSGAVFLLVFVALAMAAPTLQDRWPVARRGVLHAWWLILGGIALVAFLAIAPNAVRGHLSMFHRYYLAEVHLWTAVAGLLGVALWARGRAVMDARLVLVCLGLIAVPFVAGAGTLNFINVQIMLHMAPVFVAIVIAGAILSRHAATRAAQPLLRMVLAGTIVAQAFGALVWYPYRVPGPLWTQTQLVEGISALAGVRVDPATLAFFTAVRAAAGAGPEEAPLVLPLFDLPGLPLVLEGRALGSHWLTSLEEWQATNCLKLAAEGPERVPGVIIVNRDLPPELARCLVEQGIVMSDYAEAALLRNPYPWQEDLPVRVFRLESQ